MSDNARSIVLVFDESHTRIQTVSELLLISCIPRPVFTRPDDLVLTKENFIRYRDKVIGQLNRMLILSRDVATQVHAKQIQWKSFCQRTQELATTVIHLSELSAHIAYLIAINNAACEAAVSGPVANIHQLTQADLDIKFSCTRLKRSRMSDLQPHLLVDLCSTLTKSLTIMTDICRQAADRIADSNDQDQFKLCVKAITSTTGCLVSSIKSFKQQPSETHFRRVLTFCDPVISASGALLNFASESSFTGVPALLSAEGLEVYKSIVGLCMSIASANIQICQAVRDLVYSSSTKRQQDRMSLCVESVTRSSSQLRDLLLSHEFLPDPGKVDPSCSVQNQTSKLSGFFGASADNHLDISKSPHSDHADGTLATSVEKDFEATSRESHAPVARVVKHSADVSGSNNQEENHRWTHPLTQSISSSSSLPSSGPEVSEASLDSGNNADGGLKSPSPQHLSSSPVSISSSSATSLHLNVGQEHVEGDTLTALESQEEPAFVFEN